LVTVIAERFDGRVIDPAASDATAPNIVVPALALRDVVVHRDGSTMIACIILFNKYSYSIYRIHINKEMRKA
jgi:hypothetical protein